VSDPMVLATITLPPNSTSSPSQAFTIEAAYLNEGKIQTNVKNGGIVGIGRSIKPGTKAIQNPVVFRNNKLYVSFGIMPVMVQIYTLVGRNIHTQFAGAAGNATYCVDLSQLPSAGYIYRIVNNNSVIHSGKVLVHR
jgi:hypothetical protein